MLPLPRGVVATCALLLASPALAQSKDDITSRIDAALPDNGRGQITASGLRGVLNSLNAARGQPSGIAELDVQGKLPVSTIPTSVLQAQPDGKLPIFGALSMRGPNVYTPGDLFYSGAN